MGHRPERPTAPPSATEPSSTDAGEADFVVPENANAKAIVELVADRIRRTSSGVYAVVEPVTKRHRRV